MTDTPLLSDRTDPDNGPVASAIMSVCMATVAAIGAASATAIGSTMVFEVTPVFGSIYERLSFTDSASRWAGEAVGLIVLLVGYRKCRGLPAWPRRASILGLMKVTAVIGLLSARFVAHLGPWLGR